LPTHLLGLTPLVSVFDMPKAIDFYCRSLGFQIVNSSPEIDAPEGRYFHWAWLRLGDAELMLNTAYDAGQRPVARDVSRWKGHADTCLYFGCSDVDQIYEELAERGLDVKRPKNTDYGMRQLYLRDPDGYMLCFQHPVRA
jgi:glyoxylase I family protein